MRQDEPGTAPWWGGGCAARDRRISRQYMSSFRAFCSTLPSTAGDLCTSTANPAQYQLWTYKHTNLLLCNDITGSLLFMSYPVHILIFFLNNAFNSKLWFYFPVLFFSIREFQLARSAWLWFIVLGLQRFIMLNVMIIIANERTTPYVSGRTVTADCWWVTILEASAIGCRKGCCSHVNNRTLILTLCCRHFSLLSP